MTSAFLVLEGTADGIRGDFESVGVAVIGSSDLRSMVKDVVACAPDLVVCCDSYPDDALFASTEALRSISPRPVVVFTTDPDAAKIERATASGIHAYVVNGYGLHRLRSVIHVAQARFRHEQLLREELSDVQHRFNERKLVDRAKGILMRVRNIGEDEAYKVLRSAAMQSKLRIGQVAQQVIDASRYAEAVNRAGQLRMLSQRVVLLHALLCVSAKRDTNAALFKAATDQIETNLTVLGRTLSKPTFGDVLDAVSKPWTALKAALAHPPEPSRLAALDLLAEKLLAQAEALTRTLEIAGFVAALQVINISGRQRMLSQRLAKHAILAAVLDDEQAAAHRAALAVPTKAFAEGLAYLEQIPLSTPEIRDRLAQAKDLWEGFAPALRQARTPEALAEIAAGSEIMLAHFERLTDLYERSMQTLLE